MDPILKWVGGKGRLLSTLYPLAPREGWTRYIEPFLGGGAFFFGLDQDRFAGSVLGDENADLMLFYDTVEKKPARVASVAAGFAAKHSGVNYIYARDLYNALLPFRKDRKRADAEISVLHSALLIYLNKTCFNGLYRVSATGRFNVPPNPKSKWNPSAIELVKPLLEASDALRRAQLFQGGFSELFEEHKPGEGDFIFCDPPYVPGESMSGFTSYTKNGFSPLDLMSLFLALSDAGKRGAKWMLTHRDTPYARELAADFHVFEYLAPRSVAADGKKREPVRELCIRNYKNV